MLKTANISDPDDVQRILTCTNSYEFFSTGKYRESDLEKARQDRADKIMMVLQLIMANVGTCEDSLSPRYGSLHYQELEPKSGLLACISRRFCTCS